MIPKKVYDSIYNTMQPFLYNSLELEILLEEQLNLKTFHLFPNYKCFQVDLLKF